MTSPFTRQEALFDLCEKVGAEEPWLLVQELDGTADFGSADILARCEAQPLTAKTALATFSRVILHHAADSIPAIVTEAEEAQDEEDRALGGALGNPILPALREPSVNRAQTRLRRLTKATAPRPRAANAEGSGTGV